MPDIKVVSEKFVAVYDRRKNGGNKFVTGFLGSDPGSGGYPYFADEPDDTYLRNELSDAIKDAKTIDGMTSYSGHEHVDFHSVRIVRYKVTIEEIEDLEEAKHDALVASAKDKLSADELAALLEEHTPRAG